LSARKETKTLTIIRTYKLHQQSRDLRHLLPKISQAPTVWIQNLISAQGLLSYAKIHLYILLPDLPLVETETKLIEVNMTNTTTVAW